MADSPPLARCGSLGRCPDEEVMIFMRHHSSILVRDRVSDLVRILERSYNAGKVDKGDPLRILCAHTIAIGVSDVDVHIETLVNIGRILNTLMIRANLSGAVSISHSRVN